MHHDIEISIGHFFMLNEVILAFYLDNKELHCVLRL